METVILFARAKNYRCRLSSNRKFVLVANYVQVDKIQGCDTVLFIFTLIISP